MAFGTFDKRIIFFKIKEAKVVFVINVPHTSVNFFSYSKSNKRLYTAGFEKEIVVYNIDIDKDFSLCGKLKGH